MRNTDRGFSLIELLIVVAIILILASISIPNILRSKMAANEASAAESLQTLNSACFIYWTTYNSYPAALSNLGPKNPASSTGADLVDSVIASGTKSGYSFTYGATQRDSQGAVLSYTITAVPIRPGTTGQRSFFTDTSGVIRANPNGEATAESTPIS
jgi:type IV pilus assembly protein PilA